MKFKIKNKDGVIQLSDSPNIVLALIVIGIFLAIGSLILTEVRDNPALTANQTAFNATTSALEGLDTLSSFQTIIAVVVAAALILGVVFLIRT